MKNNSKLKRFLILLGAGLGIYVVLAGLIYSEVISEYNAQILSMAGIYIIVALSLNLVTGFTGQLALGQAGFMSVGAYGTAVAVMQFHIPMVISIFLGGMVAALFGLVVGFPTLRLRGDYLAIATLGFGEIIRVVMINLEGITGGAAGLKGIPALADTGDFILDATLKFTWIYVFALGVVILLSNLIKSSPGRAIVSVREDEIASGAMGINTSYYKMFSFTLASFIAGVGGGLYALFINYLNPDVFNFLYSINIVVIIVMGGLGSITGTIFAGIAYTFILEWLRFLKDVPGMSFVNDGRLVIFGVGMIALMLFWPGGLMGSREISIVGLWNKITRKKGVA